MVTVVYMERDLLAADESCIGTSSFCDAVRMMDSSQKRGVGQTYTTFLFPSFLLSTFYFSFFLPPCSVFF